MGMYRLGDIVRMTRKSLDITQEQLSEGLCSVETLSRIETGKQSPSRELYDLLMERMGRIRERAYSILSVSDYVVLDKMKQFEECLRVYNHQKAETVLKELEPMIGKTVLDRQFLIRAKSNVDYHQKRITCEEYLSQMEQAILLTIPKYRMISLSGWPLTYLEAMLLLNISSAYAEREDYTKSIQLLKEAVSALQHSYMDEQQSIIIQIAIYSNLSKWYGLNGKHEEAIVNANVGVELCKKHKLGSAVVNLLYSIVWNKEKLIERGDLSIEQRNNCIKELKRIYYIAAAMQQSFLMEFIEKHLLDYYNISMEVSC